MNISSVTNLPLNYEASRVENLIPSQLRTEAQTFIKFMEEYYTFMNTPGNPSYVLSSANEQHDLDQVEDAYIENLQALLSPYIPFNVNTSIIKDKRRFFRLLVRYFYNTRGSRQSVRDFFRIFYNAEVEIIDTFDPEILVELDNFTGDSQDIIANWYPYSYGISTSIPISKWRVPYKALVHPLGWRFFAYLTILIESLNEWATIEPDEIPYDSAAVSDWFFTPPENAHTPVSQPSALYRNILNYDFSVEEYTTISRSADILLSIGTGENEGHLILTKRDFVASLKCLDETPANLHEYLTFESTEQPFSYNYIFDFINVSSEVSIQVIP